MRRVALIVVSMCVATTASAQLRPKRPKPVVPMRVAPVRTLVTLDDVYVDEVISTPVRDRLYYTTDTQLFMADLATGRSTRVADGEMGNIVISPKGDQLVFYRTIDEDKPTQLWTMPVDPKTGLASGPARRLTLSLGDQPQFSPDGKLIAFSAADSNSATTSAHLAVVSPNGGAERIVARPPSGGASGGIGDVYWSADGKSLVFAADDTTNRRGWTYYSVGLAGGPVTRLPIDFGKGTPGLSPDGKHMAVWEIPNVYLVTDPSGRAFARFPLVTTDFGWWGIVWRDSQSLLRVTTHRDNVVRQVALDGTSRELIGHEYSAEAPSWSPDGRYIATFGRMNGRRALLLLDTSGTLLRTYRDGVPAECCMYDMGLQNGREVEHTLSESVVWSPDSRTVAYHGGPGDAAIRILDIATGRVQRLGERVAQVRDGQIRWRSDGRAIEYAAQGTVPRWSIHEVDLAGHDRIILDSLPEGRPWGMRNDSIAVFDGDTGVFTVNVRSRQRVRISNTLGYPAASNSDLSLFAVRDRASDRSLRIIDGSGQQRSVVQVANATIEDAIFLPDAKHLALRVREPKGQAIYLADVDGSESTRLFALPRGQREPMLTLSPDGRRLLVTYAVGPVTSTISEVDLRPVLSPTAH